MKKIRLVIEILLVITAIVVMIYNFNIYKRIAYFASIVAVCGTVAILLRDIWQRRNKE